MTRRSKNSVITRSVSWRPAVHQCDRLSELYVVVLSRWHSLSVVGVAEQHGQGAIDHWRPPPDTRQPQSRGWGRLSPDNRGIYDQLIGAIDS
jgi:hypothetical protein